MQEDSATSFSQLGGDETLLAEKEAMTGVQPTNSSTDTPVNNTNNNNEDDNIILKKTISQTDETDYDMPDVEDTQDQAVKLNESYKRPAEDDEYDDF